MIDTATLTTDLDEAIEREQQLLDVEYPGHLGNEHTTNALKAAKIHLAELTEQLAKTKQELEQTEFALAYLASCTAATAEGLLNRKSTPKSELARHHRICTMLLQALQGEDIGKSISSNAIIGTQKRLKDVISELSE